MVRRHAPTFWLFRGLSGLDAPAAAMVASAVAIRGQSRRSAGGARGEIALHCRHVVGGPHSIGQAVRAGGHQRRDAQRVRAARGRRTTARDHRAGRELSLRRPHPAHDARHRRRTDRHHRHRRSEPGGTRPVAVAAQHARVDRRPPVRRLRNPRARLRRPVRRGGGNLRRAPARRTVRGAARGRPGTQGRARRDAQDARQQFTIRRIADRPGRRHRFRLQGFAGRQRARDDRRPAAAPHSRCGHRGPRCPVRNGARLRRQPPGAPGERDRRRILRRAAHRRGRRLPPRPARAALPGRPLRLARAGGRTPAARKLAARGVFCRPCAANSS